jgi:hypothetical protein
MKCYHHPETDAVGICKACSRGICRACAKEAGTSISCQGQCKEKVLRLDKLIAQNEQASKNYKHIRKNGLAQSLFLLCPGLAFLGIGFLNDELLAQVLGITFTSYGLYVLYRTVTFPKITSDPRS